jgi:RNase H-like domain found in reverse transcriptase
MASIPTLIRRAILSAPVPKNVKAVRSFLGFAGYYRRFIQDFSQIARPLNALLKKDRQFEWTTETDEAFRTFKEKLTSAPVMEYPDWNQPFILQTDGSTTGLGVVLSQRGKDGLEHPLAYSSRSLNPAECNYSATELECLAVVWACTYCGPL